MRAYFQRKLLRWKGELLADSNETIQNLKQEPQAEADLADRASLETDRSLELRTRDRERKLIAKIDAALQRIDVVQDFRRPPGGPRSATPGWRKS